MSKLIERGHHDSYENPPDIPLISGSTATKNKEMKSLSPMKNAQLHRSCLEDLKTLKSLKDDGIFSDNEFENENSLFTQIT